jgi:uncharacterized membrane protein YidH (DUF202 family)
MTDQEDPRLQASKKSAWLRFRYWFMLLGTALVVFTFYLHDPDAEGFRTRKILMSLSMLVVLCFAAHIARRGLLDYVDLSRAWKMGLQTPEGAARMFQGVCILIAGLLLAGASLVVNAAEVPTKAYAHAQPIKKALNAHWSDLSWPHYVPALIAHESGCPGMKSCWEPTARFKTSKEEGAGFSMITRAWRPDGSLRFDNVTALSQKYPALSGMNWGNVYQRPDLQVTALVLLARESWHDLRGVDDHWERLAMTDACYNGGCRDLHSERERCALKKDCDPQRWFGHVEQQCVKSRAPLYGTRSACDINRYHVRDVLLTRMRQYRRFFA